MEINHHLFSIWNMSIENLAPFLKDINLIIPEPEIKIMAKNL